MTKESLYQQAMREGAGYQLPINLQCQAVVMSLHVAADNLSEADAGEWKNIADKIYRQFVSPEGSFVYGCKFDEAVVSEALQEAAKLFDEYDRKDNMFMPQTQGKEMAEECRKIACEILGIKRGE